MPSLFKALVLSASLLSSLGQCAPHLTTRGKASVSNGKAIYMLSNDAQNGVVAVAIAADGTLSKGALTATGGAGSNTIDGTTKTPAAPDALDAQSSLTLVGKNIFAVNAGSNTLTMMTISDSDPTALKVVGQSVQLPGEFPVTVAASAKHKLVCVGTTGAKAGISCSNFSHKNGLGPMDGLRPFQINQTTPPVGPLNTVSQTFFSEDESKLFTTVKGDPTVNNTGFLSVFPVDAGNKWSKWSQGGASSLSTTETRSSPAGTAVLFGSANIAGTSNIFASDAAFGAAILAVDPTTNQATTVAKQAIDGQIATCWAAISPATGTGFVTDVAVNRIVEMSLTDAKIISITNLTSAQDQDPGLIDLKAAGNFVYALSPGNGTTNAAISVLDVSGGQGSVKLAQHFDLAVLGAGKNSQGMAVLL